MKPGPAISIASTQRCTGGAARERLDQALRDLARARLQRLGQLHRGRAGEVAVRRPAWATRTPRERVPRRQLGERVAQGVQQLLLDCNHREILRFAPVRDQPLAAREWAAFAPLFAAARPLSDGAMIARRPASGRDAPPCPTPPLPRPMRPSCLRRSASTACCAASAKARPARSSSAATSSATATWRSSGCAPARSPTRRTGATTSASSPPRRRSSAACSIRTWCRSSTPWPTRRRRTS